MVPLPSGAGGGDDGGFCVLARRSDGGGDACMTSPRSGTGGVPRRSIAATVSPTLTWKLWRWPASSSGVGGEKTRSIHMTQHAGMVSGRSHLPARSTADACTPAIARDLTVEPPEKVQNERLLHVAERGSAAAAPTSIHGTAGCRSPPAHRAIAADTGSATRIRLDSFAFLIIVILPRMFPSSLFPSTDAPAA
jgi:hypothetical protein